jgi:hypothetical protein
MVTLDVHVACHIAADSPECRPQTAARVRVLLDEVSGKLRVCRISRQHAVHQQLIVLVEQLRRMRTETIQPIHFQSLTLPAIAELLVPAFGDRPS